MSLVELKRQFFEISVAAGDAVECSLRLVMFDKVMPDTGLLIMTKDIFPVDQSAAHRGEIGGIAKILRPPGSDVGHGLNVFHMDQRKASGMFVEVWDWILSCCGDPAKVEFHLY